MNNKRDGAGLLKVEPSRALALSCNKGRIEIPTRRTALLLPETSSFGSSWVKQAIGGLKFLFFLLFLLVSPSLILKETDKEDGNRT